MRSKRRRLELSREIEPCWIDAVHLASLLAPQPGASVRHSAFAVTCVRVRHIGLRGSPDAEERSDEIVAGLPIAVGFAVDLKSASLDRSTFSPVLCRPT